MEIEYKTIHELLKIKIPDLYVKVIGMQKEMGLTEIPLAAYSFL